MYRIVFLRREAQEKESKQKEEEERKHKEEELKRSRSSHTGITMHNPIRNNEQRIESENTNPSSQFDIDNLEDALEELAEVGGI